MLLYSEKTDNEEIGNQELGIRKTHHRQKSMVSLFLLICCEKVLIIRIFDAELIFLPRRRTQVRRVGKKASKKALPIGSAFCSVPKLYD